MKKLLIIWLFLLNWQSAIGQERTTHSLFWGRVALADTINSKLKWEIFLQKRTQNNYPGDPNIFHSPQFESYWVWLHYSLNRTVKVSISPFGYFESHVLNNSSDDVNMPAIKEFRWTSRIEHETKGRYFNYFNRYNLEYRWRDLKNNGEYIPNWRIRYMVRFEKPIKGILSKKKPVTVIVYDELFIQFGKAVKGNPNIFDQNRVYIGASYEVLKNIKLNFGYIWGFQERNSGKEFDDINTYWVVLTFDNLISQFRKNK